MVGTVITVALTYLAVYYSRFFKSRKRLLFLSKFFYSHSFKTSENLSLSKPFLLDVAFDLKHMFFDSLKHSGYIVNFNRERILRDLKMDEMNYSSSLEFAIKEGKQHNITKYQYILEDIFHACEDLRMNMPLSEFIMKYEPYISKKYSCKVLHHTEHAIKKKYFIFPLSYKKHLIFADIVEKYIYNETNFSMSYGSAKEREKYMEWFNDCLQHAGANFLYKYLYDLNVKKKIRLERLEYIQRSLECELPANEDVIISDVNEGDYSIKHIATKLDSDIFYRFELSVNNSYLMERIQSKTLMQFIEESILKMVNIESFRFEHGIKKDTESDIVKSPFVILNNPYDAYLLAGYINETFNQFCNSQQTVIREYISENVKRDLRSPEDETNIFRKGKQKIGG